MTDPEAFERARDEFRRATEGMTDEQVDRQIEELRGSVFVLTDSAEVSETETWL